MPTPTIATAPAVLVTGASGFVGRHVVQKLRNRGFHVKALVRRIPTPELDPDVELVIGDLSRPETYTAALEGVSSVVHTALTDNLADEPHATSTLVRHSALAGVLKFIHLSSIAVYGNPKSGIITEETAPLPSPDAYSRTKLAIEEALQQLSASLDIVALRLGCVYGPGGGWWTGGLLDQMQHGKLILVNQGTGIANLIHVFDVGSIVSLVLERSGPRFDVFNVTDGMPTEWSRYFSELEKIAGKATTVSMSVDEAREHSRKWLRPSFTRRLIRKITGAPVIFPLDEKGIENFASRAVYSNEKSVNLLHFVPEYDLESGMRTLSSPPSQHASVFATYQAAE